MSKQQIEEFAKGFGYTIEDRKSASWTISHIRTYHGDRTVTLRDVHEAWKAAQ